MHGVEVVLVALLVAVAGLNVVASRSGIPYPIVLVVGGLALGLVPGLPEVEMEPDLVLVIFLPPLLYSAAFFADLRALRRYARALTLTAVGLVLATIGVVAVVGHTVLGLPWPMAFVLGAILSPTDPLAATAIMRRLGVPRSIVDLVEGESLVNDAAALVGFRLALAAAIDGHFDAGHAAVEFLTSAVGGIAIGLAVGVVVAIVRRHLDDPPTEITISLATGYLAFVPAEHLHLSGVLAAVSAGLYVGWRSPSLTSPSTRLQATAVWETLTFVLNALLFVLIGLQLPAVVDGLAGRSVLQLAGWAAAVAGAVVAVRFLWLFTTPYVIRMVDRRPSQRELRVGAGPRSVVAWSGLRGAVSLATALAIPITVDGRPLAGRDLIVFVTFAVVLVTLVGQGLTLPVLVRRLGVVDDGSEEAREELHARLQAAKAALAEIEVVADEGWAPEDALEGARRRHSHRKQRFAIQTGKVDADGFDDATDVRRRLQRRLLAAERDAVVALRNRREISNEVMHRLERELDLDESHLD